MFAALQGVGLKPIVTGALACAAWGAKASPEAIDLLILPSPEHQPSLVGAVRGVGFQQVTDSEALRFRYVDPRSNGVAEVRIQEAATPFPRQLHSRAQTGEVLWMGAALAGCEDLILHLAGSGKAFDREATVDLLRCTAGRMDAQYLRAEAEKAGTFEIIKSAWQQAKQQG